MSCDHAPAKLLDTLLECGVNFCKWKPHPKISMLLHWSCSLLTYDLHKIDVRQRGLCQIHKSDIMHGICTQNTVFLVLNVLNCNIYKKEFHVMQYSFFMLSKTYYKFTKIFSYNRPWTQIIDHNTAKPSVPAIRSITSPWNHSPTDNLSFHEEVLSISSVSYF